MNLPTGLPATVRNNETGFAKEKSGREPTSVYNIRPTRPLSPGDLGFNPQKGNES
jgi:hypothetical protein